MTPAKDFNDAVSIAARLAPSFSTKGQERLKDLQTAIDKAAAADNFLKTSLSVSTADAFFNNLDDVVRVLKETYTGRVNHELKRMNRKP